MKAGAYTRFLRARSAATTASSRAGGAEHSPSSNQCNPTGHASSTANERQMLAAPWHRQAGIQC